jgi:hypothetical protein
LHSKINYLIKINYLNHPNHDFFFSFFSIPIIKRAYFHFAKAEAIEEIPQVQDHQAQADLQTDLKDQGLHNPAKN